MKREKNIPLYKKVWCKVRYWQGLCDISDNELAAQLRVSPRTLHEYDKNARNVTLEKIDLFLRTNGLDISDFWSH